MAATKHSLADGAAGARPAKKTRVDNGDGVGKAQPRKGNKDKKKDAKKGKREEDEAAQDGPAVDGDSKDADAEDKRNADKKARKEQKKEEKKMKKKEKKLKEAQEQAQSQTEQAQEPEPQDTDMADADQGAPVPPAEEKKSKKRPRKDKGSDEPTNAAVEAKEDRKKSKKTKAKGKDKPDAAGSTERHRGGAYVQTMSLSGVPQADIDAFMSEHQITITDPRGGKGAALRPVTEFDHLPSTNLLEKRPSPFAGFRAPTPIQAASWPSTLSGRDVVGVAETGSGKTMAFALPCVEAVSAMGGPAGATKAVVVSPTRELAMQTHVQLAALAALAGLKCVCLYGGASKEEQRALLGRGCDVIVATPGRLKDFMSDGTVDLAAAAFVVLDEADRMLDKGFEDDIKHILASCLARERRQTLMFTATWPQSVQALASTFMVDPVKVTIGSASNETAGGAVELQANARIAQRVEVLEPQEKEPRLLQIVRQRQQGKARNDRILVFCLYKKEATRVEAFLARKGVRVGGIHGDLKQEQRTRSLEAFKTGQTPVLVATDVAARGLDIPDVKLVINVTFPLTIEDYVHRIGRTGRAGNTGEAMTFFTTQDKAHSGSLINILKGANQPVPDELLKFGTTVKKKTHDMYGSFFKDVDMTQKATKITFD